MLTLLFSSRFPALPRCCAGVLLHTLAACALAAGLLGAGTPATAQGTGDSTPDGLARHATAAVLQDPSGLQTRDDVQKRFERGEGRPARPEEIMPTGGSMALWYRLELPAVTAPTSLVLALPHSGMNRVDLYWPLASGNGWAFERSGDALPVARWPVPYLHPAFELLQQPGELRTGYLRIEHSHPIGVRWTISATREFHESGKRWHFLLGAYSGLMALVVVMCVLSALFWRDYLHAYFAAYVLVVAIDQLSMTGLSGEYLWPNSPVWNDMAANVLTAFAAALAHLFMRELVVERVARWTARLMLLLAVTGGVLGLCFLLIGRNPFFTIAGPYYLVSFTVYLGVALWYAWQLPRVGAWVLAGVTVLLGFAMFPLLRNMEQIPLSFMTQYGAQLGVALEIPLLLVALHLRSRERRDNRSRVGAMARVDPLTGMANHSVMMERLNQLLAHRQRDPAAGAVLRVRIGNLQQIRDEYGLQVAQMALVHAGSCITQIAREGDTVARHREGDFVLILQGLVSRDQLSEMAQRLIARGLASTELLPPGTVLQLKIAVAEPTLRTVGVGPLLQLLETAVAELAARPGKALRFVSAAT